VSVVKYRCCSCGAEYHEEPPPACPRCIFGGLARLPDAWAGKAIEHSLRRPKIVTAMDLRAARFQRRSLGPVWSALFGDEGKLPERSVIGLSGVPSSGKSTLAQRLAEDGTFLAPLYVCSEEGLSAGVHDRAARIEATRTSFTDAANFPEVTECLGAPDDCPWDLLILDSISSLGFSARDLGILAKHYAVSILALCQSRRDGTFRGSMQLLHEADAWVEVSDEQTFVIKKSWWGALREGRIPGTEITQEAVSNEP